jgi:chloramphenicol O-acetyltransferase
MDRRDGYKVKDIHGIQNILIDFKPNRCDSAVYMNTKIDMTNFVKFINKKKKDIEGLTFYHGIVDVMAKTLYSRPYMNRFIANRTMYMHKDVTLAQTIKVEFAEDSIESLIVLKIDEEDTLEDISRKTKERVDKIRKSKEASDSGKKSANDAADMIGNLPKFLRIPVVGMLKFLDRHDWLPKSVIDDNLYYSSAILSNIGSFKVGAIYHNLTNFGTSSSLITFGEIKEEDGKWTMEMGATIDERIADGFYFCKCLKLIEYIFANPELMMEPAGKKVSIPDVKKKK